MNYTYLLPIISNCFYIFPVLWVIHRCFSIYKHLSQTSLSQLPNSNMVLKKKSVTHQFTLTILFSYLGNFMGLINLIICSTVYHSTNPSLIWLDYTGISICICNGMLFISGILKPTIKLFVEVLTFIIQFSLAIVCRDNTNQNYYALLALPSLFLLIVIFQCFLVVISQCCILKYCRYEAYINYDLQDVCVTILAWIISLILFEISNNLDNDSIEKQWVHSLWHLASAISMLFTSEITNTNFQIFKCNFNDILTKREEYYIDWVNKNYNA